MKEKEIGRNGLEIQAAKGLNEIKPLPVYFPEDRRLLLYYCSFMLPKTTEKPEQMFQEEPRDEEKKNTAHNESKVIALEDYLKEPDSSAKETAGKEPANKEYTVVFTGLDAPANKDMFMGQFNFIFLKTLDEMRAYKGPIDVMIINEHYKDGCGNNRQEAERPIAAEDAVKCCIYAERGRKKYFIVPRDTWNMHTLRHVLNYNNVENPDMSPEDILEKAKKLCGIKEAHEHSYKSIPGVGGYAIIEKEPEVRGIGTGKCKNTPCSLELEAGASRKTGPESLSSSERKVYNRAFDEFIRQPGYKPDNWMSERVARETYAEKAVLEFRNSQKE